MAAANDSGGGFGQALRELFTAAGSPTLTATAAAAGNDRVTVQRLSNWRSGRHLPDSFNTIAPVLVWLTFRARDNPHSTEALTTTTAEARAGADSVAAVRSMRDWYRLFITAHNTDAMNLPTRARIDAAELLIAHPDPADPTDNDGHVKDRGGGSLPAACLTTGLKTAILQLTGIDPATGTPVATEVPLAALAADAADLLAATSLTTTSDTSTAGGPVVRWTDPMIATEWNRAASLIERYRPALAARTALLADAARWNAAGDPQGLYTWQQLTTCGRHLQALPGAIAATTAGSSGPGNSGAHSTPPTAQAYRFGDGVTAEHIPVAALLFWNASQDAAQRQLTMHRLIMATVIGLIALAVIVAGIAGFLTS